MIVNLTPHPITNFKASAPDMVDEPEYTQWVLRILPKAEEPLRLSEITNFDGYIEGSPLALVQYGHLTYNPPLGVDSYYVVSLATALAVPHRTDFLVPYREVRNLKGTVIGCRAFAKPC